MILAALLGAGALGATPSAGPGLSSGDSAGDLALAAVALVVAFAFLVNFGYDVAFETLASGRTPGKRWTGLRVVRADGGPVTFSTSAVRNLMRLVDGLFAYAVGVVAILVSARNQRLGDLAAGTVVVRERRAPAEEWARHEHHVPVEDLRTWDVSAVTTEEVATVRRFLDRRAELTAEARGRLAHEFALRLRPKVAGAPDDLPPETFLEHLAAAKAART